MKMISNYLAADLEIEGNVYSNASTRIDAKCNGHIETLDELTFGREARIYGSVTAQRIRVDGSVQGTLKAIEQIRLLAAGKVEGELHTPAGGLQIDEGSWFSGNFHLGIPPEKEQLKIASLAQIPAKVE